MERMVQKNASKGNSPKKMILQVVFDYYDELCAVIWDCWPLRDFIWVYEEYYLPYVLTICYRARPQVNDGHWGYGFNLWFPWKVVNKQQGTKVLAHS